MFFVEQGSESESEGQEDEHGGLAAMAEFHTMKKLGKTRLSEVEDKKEQAKMFEKMLTSC